LERLNLTEIVIEFRKNVLEIEKGNNLKYKNCGV